jgi:hypothetical protein
MREPYAPRPLYRWQLGLLLQALPRRLIAVRFRDDAGGGSGPIPPRRPSSARAVRQLPASP